MALNAFAPSDLEVAFAKRTSMTVLALIATTGDALTGSTLLYASVIPVLPEIPAIKV